MKHFKIYLSLLEKNRISSKLIPLTKVGWCGGNYGQRNTGNKLGQHFMECQKDWTLRYFILTQNKLWQSLFHEWC